MYMYMYIGYLILLPLMDEYVPGNPLHVYLVPHHACMN
jgi:hypothetical protein